MDAHILFLFLATAMAGSGATLFSNGTPIEQTPSATYGTADHDGGIHRSSLFTLGNPATIRSMSFEGAYSPSDTPSVPDRFNVIIFDLRMVLGPNPLPNNVVDESDLVVATRIATGIQRIGREIYRYEANFITPITLSPGNYAISLANDTAGDSDDSWCWVGNEVPGPAAGYNQGGLQDRGLDYELGTSLAFVFALRDEFVIPEPTIGILLAGAGTLTLIRRRRWRDDCAGRADAFGRRMF
jgi:hypothetical protein